MKVRVWLTVSALLQLSRTVQVRVTEKLQPLPDSGPSLKVATRPEAQLSVTLAVPKAALISAAVGLQLTADGGLSVITGAVVSATVISWVTVEILPQLSVSVQVRVMMAGQLPDGAESVPITDPGASQLSV